MKALLAAVTLLALTSPAFAAKAKPQDFPDIRKWVKLYGACTYLTPDDNTARTCDAADKLGKKLEARGYCLYGHGSVGKTGAKYFYPGYDSAGTGGHWTRHCWEITNGPDYR